MKIMKYILICGNIFFIACGGFIVYCNITDITVQILLVGIFMALCFMNLGSYFYFREQFVVLSSQICHYSENIMHGNSVQKIWNKETITSKVVMELEKMKKVIAFQIAESKKEKKELQEMISEITHQIKTPISNIKMYGEMFTDTDVHTEQSKQFMDIMKQQLMKVEFLLDALVKCSCAVK